MLQHQGSFELTDLSKPVYLHAQMKKFWEIKILNLGGETGYEVLVRCGKLIEDLKEDLETVESVSKVFQLFPEALDYLEKHVKKKLLKGYEHLNKEDAKVNQEVRKSESNDEKYARILRGESFEKGEFMTDANFAAQTYTEPEKFSDKYKIKIVPAQDMTQPSWMNPTISQERSGGFEEIPVHQEMEEEKEAADQRRKAESPLKRNDLKKIKKDPTDRSVLDELLPETGEEINKNKSLTDYSFDLEAQEEKDHQIRRKGKKDEEFEIDFQKEKDKGPFLDIQESEPSSPKSSFKENIEKYKGEYLTMFTGKGLKYCKIQVFENYVKIDHGMAYNKRSTDVEIKQYKDKRDAVLQAQMKVDAKIKSGFVLNSERFSYDFNPEEFGMKVTRACKAGVPHSVISSPRSTYSADYSKSRPDINVFQKNKEDVIDFVTEILKAKEKTKDDEAKSDIGISLISDGRKSFISKDKNAQKNNEFKMTNKSPIKEISASKDISPSRSRASSMDFEQEDDSSLYKSKYSPIKRDQPFQLRDFSANSQDDFPLGRPLSGPYPNLMDAMKYEAQRDVKNWYISEKLDGIRAFWDGKNFWNKRGDKKFYAPPWFIMDFPKSPLDGVLYLGKGNETKLTKILQKVKPVEEEWNEIKYMVFDAPEVTGNWEHRYKKMKAYFEKSQSPYILLHEQTICANKEELAKQMEKIENFGGEGLILKDPRGQYEQKKSNYLLKYEPYYEGEATIIGIEPGKGKTEKKCGALKVRNDSLDIEFTVGVGLPDSVKNNPPKVGTKITYSYSHLNTAGVPNRPKFLRTFE